MADFKVAIGMPAMDQAQTMCMLDLNRLYRHVDKHNKSVELLNPLMATGSLIPMQRQMIAEAALRLEATHILWIDTDMRFPPTTLWGLLGRNRDIVGASYPERRAPFRPVAFRSWNDMNLRAYTQDADTGVEQVVGLGSGMLLVKMDVYRRLPRPWYLVGWSQERGNYLGEDLYFAYRAGQAGFEVYLDHDLSKMVRHIGSFEYARENAIDYAVSNPDEVDYQPGEKEVRADRMPAVVLDAYGHPVDAPPTETVELDSEETHVNDLPDQPAKE